MAKQRSNSGGSIGNNGENSIWRKSSISISKKRRENNKAVARGIA